MPAIDGSVKGIEVGYTWIETTETLHIPKGNILNTKATFLHNREMMPSVSECLCFEVDTNAHIRVDNIVDVNVCNKSYAIFSNVWDSTWPLCS
jgi:hypothetical protein